MSDSPWVFAALAFAIAFTISLLIGLATHHSPSHVTVVVCTTQTGAACPTPSP